MKTLSAADAGPAAMMTDKANPKTMLRTIFFIICTLSLLNGGLSNGCPI
jgi:hypothetical protein